MALQWLMTVEIPCTNGIAKDATQLTFPIRTADTGLDQLNCDAIALAWQTALNAPQSSALSIGSRLSPSRSRALPMTFRFYNTSGHLDGSPHGSPAFVTTGLFIATPGGDIGLPDEMSVVMTTRDSTAFGVPVEAPDGVDAGAAPDRPRQRRTGRNYWGPLSIQVVDTSAGGRPMVKETFRTDLLDWAEDWKGALAALNADYEWCVWSRVDAAYRSVNSVEVDNAFDVQRRRGIGPTVRTARVI